MVDTPKEENPDTILVDDDGSVMVELPEEGTVAQAAEEGDKPVERKRLKELPVNTQEAVIDPSTVEVLQTSLQKAQESQRATEAALSAERERNRRMEAATRQAQEREAEAREAAENNQLVALNTSIDQATQELDTLKGDYARQMEAGEFAKIADTQARMAQLAAKLDRLQTQKDSFIPSAKRVPAPTVSEGMPATPSRDQYLSQFVPEARSWLEAHPECLPTEVGGDASANARMMTGHYAALAQRVTPNTAEYFRIIEEHTGHRKPEAAPASPVPKPAVVSTKPAPVQVSAPPSREPPSTTGALPRNVRQVRLTKDEKDMARLSFPDMKEAEAYAQYARNKVELEAEGKLGRTTH